MRFLNCLFLLMAFSSLRARKEQLPPSAPNILLIMTDDQGYGDLGLTGNGYVKTPDQAHKRRGGFELKWYPYKKVRYGNVQYTTENQPPPQPVNSFQ